MGLENFSTSENTGALIESVEIETESGYFNLLYNQHSLKGPLRGETVKNADAIVLELMEKYDTEEKVRSLIPGTNKLYSEILKEAAAKNKPVFLVDLQPSEKSTELFFVILTLEGLLGIKLIEYGVQDLRNKPNRRDFLKSASKFVVSAYLLLPVLEGIPGLARSYVDPNSKVLKKTQSLLNNAKSTLHPELPDNDNTRNALIAQKSNFIASQLQREIGRKPRIALPIGAAHSNIENSFRESSEQRFKEIKSDLKKNTAKQALIARVDFLTEGIKVTFLEDPVLIKG